MPVISEHFDDRLPVDPPVDEERLREIPAKRGVILLVAEDDEPIVMLTAADMRSRTRNRLADRDEDTDATPVRRADLRQITRAILFRRCESHFETDWQFLERVADLWPDRVGTMVACKPPWFVHLHTPDAYPHFARVRDVFARPGRYIGPFAAARDADAFVDALADAFDLCRSITCLRQAPDGPRCAYAEMGKCLSPVDGSIAMDDYRAVLDQAADFAAGDRQDRREQLIEQMKQAAAEQAYERAAAIKTRLDRLAYFDSPPCRFARPAEDFNYVLIQPGAGIRECRALLASRTAIQYAGPLAWPLQDKPLQNVLKTMAYLAETSPPADELGRLRMGLVSRLLFAGADRRGAVVHWTPQTTAADLADAVANARERLGLKDLAAE
ncbi:MAG: hypothetical protein GVY16_07885 [Planctomycetes bacterium]|jgi:SAM-dependent methyltransferase|nr:UvrB/UvrC motif-containing protein [Phycisphaerae bacterium]NBB95647.1 hypothetical protein [Planctomycetota bacterium]